VAHEIQQAVDARSCVWEGRALTVGQTEDWLPWEQLCWKGPDCRGGQWAEHEPAGCPGSTVLGSYQEPSQYIEGTD